MVAAVHQAYGLNVLTELEIGIRSEPGAKADIEMLIGEPSTETATVPEGEYLAGSAPNEDFLTILVRDGDGYCLRIKSLAEVRISHDARRLVCHPSPNAGIEELRELSATILSFVLPLLGIAAIHSSCVTGIPGLDKAQGAVALAGPGSSGKSTLAGHLCAGGASFVTDDLLPVTLAGPTPVVTGGSPELRVRPAATDLRRALEGRPQRTTVDARTAIFLGAPRSYPLPIELVLLPEIAPAGTGPSLALMSSADAFVELLGMGRSGGWSASPVHQLYFDVYAAIADRVPVVKVKWSPGAVSMAQMVDLLRSELP